MPFPPFRTLWDQFSCGPTRVSLPPATPSRSRPPRLGISPFTCFFKLVFAVSPPEHYYFVITVLIVIPSNAKFVLSFHLNFDSTLLIDLFKLKTNILSF